MVCVCVECNVVISPALRAYVIVSINPNKGRVYRYNHICPSSLPVNPNNISVPACNN